MICLLCFYVGFLELINNMLTSGMVPALYPDDEKEAIIGQVTPYLISRYCCGVESPWYQRVYNMPLFDSIV